jgi:uncharacterized protein (TIGR00251 family)
VTSRPAETAWRVVGDGVELAVRVTPRAGTTALAGFVADAQGRPSLQIRLSAPPIEGAANEALIAFLASTLRVRKRDVAIRAGHASRLKQVAISGDPSDLSERLTRWTEAG